jgi:hypothetical protein
MMRVLLLLSLLCVAALFLVRADVMAPAVPSVESAGSGVSGADGAAQPLKDQQAPSPVALLSGPIDTTERTRVPPAAALVQPTFTVQGSIEESLRKSIRFKTNGKTIPPSYPPDKAIAAPHLNPLQKVLDDEQRGRLEQLIAEQNKEENELFVKDFAQREAAFFRAIARGSYRLVPVYQAAPGTEPTSGNIKRMQADVSDRYNVVMKELAASLGQEYVNWMQTKLQARGEDGAVLSAIVYFTRAEEPEVFATFDRGNALGLTRRQQLKDFFASLP